MIEESWKRIRAWGSENAPEMLRDLNPGATEEQLSALEAELSVQLPEDVRRSLKVHNGESDGWPYRVFADCGTYLSTDRIIHEWEQRLLFSENLFTEEEVDIEQLIRDSIIFVEGPVKPVGFVKEWIPIMECNGDVFWASDLSPSEGGTLGQIIEVDIENCSWKVIANTFTEWLSSYVTGLEAGEYAVVEGLPTKEMDV